jgi:fatty-acyl-CoA synthase
MAGHHRTCVHPDASPYRTGLGRNDANHAPLTPLSFLERTADVYPDRVACVHGAQAYTYRQLRERCRRLASALERRGIRPGDTVAACCRTPRRCWRRTTACRCAARS